jgi:hypothetical protein
VSFGKDILATIDRFAGVLDQLGVEWAMGGSVASSVHAQPRSTNDIDVIAMLRPGHAAALARALQAEFYIDEASVRTAIIEHRSFNLIDERTFVKIDVFVPSPGPLGDGQLTRRVRVEISDGLFCWVLGREDILLQKLRWYQLGGEVSERQWNDILELLTDRTKLDLDYLQRTAAAGQLDELLERARAAS